MNLQNPITAINAYIYTRILLSAMHYMAHIHTLTPQRTNALWQTEKQRLAKGNKFFFLTREIYTVRWAEFVTVLYFRRLCVFCFTHSFNTRRIWCYYLKNTSHCASYSNEIRLKCKMKRQSE